MADPWETFKDAEVLDKAPAQLPEKTGGAPSPPEEANSAAPWETFKDAEVLDTVPDGADVDRVAREGEKMLAEQPKVTFNTPESDTFMGWGARFGRSLSFNTIDTVSARIIYEREREKFKKEGIEYQDILKAIRTGYDEDRAMSAEFAGALLPGAGIAKAVSAGGKAAARAVAKDGLVESGMHWAGRHPILARIGSASGIGAGTGAAEEAVRHGIDQSIEVAAGGEFNPQKVTEGAVSGAIVGALMGPVANEALRGAAGVAQWTKRAFAITDDAKNQRAAKHIIKSVAREGENMDQTVERLRSDITRFTEDHGRPPTLPEITSPENVKDVMRVVSYHTGLEQPAREMSERQIKVATEEFDRLVRNGEFPLRDTATVNAQMDDLFSGVMNKHGKTPVALTDNAFDALERNDDFLNKMARNNEDARRIQGVVQAKQNMRNMREKAANLQDDISVAEARTTVAELRDEIAEIVAEQMSKSDVDPSRLGQLRIMADRMDAHAKLLSSNVSEDRKRAALAAFRPSLKNAETVLRDFEDNGLKISLESANGMRRAASKASVEGADNFARAEARSIRDAIAPVGTAEVPIYGDVVKRWGQARTMVEAQNLGRSAMRGGDSAPSPENLSVYLGRGELPGRPVRGQQGPVQEGAETGARIAISRALRRGGDEAGRMAARLAREGETRESLRNISPERAEEILRGGEQLDQSISGLRAAQGKSPLKLDAEISAAQEILTGAAMGKGLGGAATAGLFTKIYGKFHLPRRVARRVVDMALDPEQSDKALRYVASRGIDAREFAAYLSAALHDSNEE